MTQENQVILYTRFKAFSWSLGTMIVPFVADNIALFNLPNWLLITLGLILSQITKYLNTPK